MTLPPHHTATGFKNPYRTDSNKSFWQYLRLRFGFRNQFISWRGQTHLVSRVPVDLARLEHPQACAQVTWLGHSSTLVQYCGRNILFDPIFSERASPLRFAGPKRVMPPSIQLDDLPRIDLVLISHNHYDHLDRATVKALGNMPFWCVPLGLKRWVERVGIAREQVAEFDWWDNQKHAGVAVTATPAQHWSGRGLHDRLQTLWCGWHIAMEEFSCWFAGDTGYDIRIFSEIGARFQSVNLALIPIGAYAPRSFMQAQHVNPEEAVKIHGDVGAHRSLGVHWGTFRLSAEAIDEPRRRLTAATETAGLGLDVFTAPALGETILIEP